MNQIAILYIIYNEFKIWTAGIFILLRSSPILEFSSTALLIITLVGATTAFFAATIGILQNDLKRIIAFSTISQLGYMVLSIGLSQYSISLFHTVNHAFFKALLFLSAGQIIHSILDQQDIFVVILSNSGQSLIA